MVETLFEIEIQRPPKGSRDAARLLHGQLRAAILDGRLAPGALMPATRRSWAVYGVSRNTAVEVYERLLNEGFLVARQGSSTKVAETLPPPSRPPRQPPSGHDPRLHAFWQSREVRRALGFWQSDEEEARVRPESLPGLELRPAIIDPQHFPQAIFRRLMGQQLRSLERTPASYRGAEGNQGNYRLRAAIAKHIAVTRAIVATPEDVLVTAGAQQAFDVLARTLVPHAGTVVAVEEPGYPPMRVAFAAAGATLAPVPVDEEGMIVDRLPTGTKVICLCPSHQFPLGVTMSRERRKALVAWARHYGAVIVEDDYDGEFRQDGAPIDALISENAADVVFYVGTFSKSMSPAVRLGFLIVPDWAMSTLVAAKNSLDWHCPISTQSAVAAFIVEGHLTRHVRRMRRVYGERRRALTGALSSRLGDWLEPLPSLYGIHVAAVARRRIDLDAVAQRLASDNVRLHSLTRYYLDKPDRQGFVFGLGVATSNEVEQGLALIEARLREI